eukprot:TRINITY_DN92653_c0_g1_i1.p1 TRINITY_DN92653_c0_g1~~TRINITY_DN92653_c0_g1_i1.p1  ORF type:complete len:183 (+),score=29.88 TRINITY_DN92653_c0_g1_i1:41-589(+)
MPEHRLHAGGSGLLASAGQGGATGWHAPSVGRAHSLSRLQRTGSDVAASNRHEDWIRDWTSQPHPNGPFASNFQVTEAPAHARWGGHGLQTTTWQMVRDAPWQRGWHGHGLQSDVLERHAADGLSKAAAQDASRLKGGLFTGGAAGAPSGGHELNMGRLGLLNGGRRWEMPRAMPLRSCPEN